MWRRGAISATWWGSLRGRSSCESDRRRFRFKFCGAACSKLAVDDEGDPKGKLVVWERFADSDLSRVARSGGTESSVSTPRRLCRALGARDASES